MTGPNANHKLHARIMADVARGVKSCPNPDCPMDNPQPLSHFYVDHGRKSGYMPRCSTCMYYRRRGVWPEWVTNQGAVTEIARAPGKGNHKAVKAPKARPPRLPRVLHSKPTPPQTLWPLFAGTHGTYKWSQDEIDFLSEYYGLAPDKWLCRQLGRTPAALETKKDQLHLIKVQGFITCLEVARILGVSSKTAQRWVYSGLLKARKNGATRVAGNFAWRIEEAHLIAFLYAYPQRYDFRRIDVILYPEWREIGRAAASGARPTTKPLPGYKRSCSLVRCFTEWEDAYILNHRGKMSYAEIGAVLRRNGRAVNGRCHRLRKEGRMVPYLDGRRGRRVEVAA